MSEAGNIEIRQKLFSPKGIWLWSLLLSPLFGEWCIYRNCATLGLKRRYFSFFCLCLMVLFYIYTILFLSVPFSNLSHLLLFLAWTFGEFIFHKWLLDGKYPGYEKRRWDFAVLSAVFILLSGLVLFGFLSVCFEYFSAKDRGETAVEEFIPEQN
ncbi:MAG: hypothetical protein ACI4UV_01685 [Victivallales bacterium]